jgi:hypothetical protein
MTSHVGMGMAATRRMFQQRAQATEAVAYLRDQPTTLLTEVLAETTEPLYAAWIWQVLDRRCDGSGVRIHSDDRTVLGLCWKCDGQGC